MPIPVFKLRLRNSPESEQVPSTLLDSSLDANNSKLTSLDALFAHVTDSPKRKPLPSLAPMVFRASTKLFRLQLCGLLSMGMVWCWVLWPYLSINVWWGMLLIILVLLLLAAVRVLLLGRGTGILSFSDRQGWRLVRGGVEHSLLLKEALVWSWLVILYFDVPVLRRSQCLLLCSDSMSVGDLARLRTWLRLCLRLKS